jgi:hypothetical protein
VIAICSPEPRYGRQKQRIGDISGSFTNERRSLVTLRPFRDTFRPLRWRREVRRGCGLRTRMRLGPVRVEYESVHTGLATLVFRARPHSFFGHPGEWRRLLRRGFRRRLRHEHLPPKALRHSLVIVFHGGLSVRTEARLAIGRRAISTRSSAVRSDRVSAASPPLVALSFPRPAIIRCRSASSSLESRSAGETGRASKVIRGVHLEDPPAAKAGRDARPGVSDWSRGGSGAISTFDRRSFCAGSDLRLGIVLQA